MKNMFLFCENEHIDTIKQQYNNSIVTDREFTGVGFYTNFYVADKSLHLKDNVNFEIGGIHASINGLKSGAGFIVFIRNGVIKCLEGYTYGEPWPKEITEYKFSIVKKDGSLIDL